MLSRMHQKLGTAGFIVAVVALIAALTGGAYAATGGLTNTEKKQVRKIARSEAKKVAVAGAPGTPGAQGQPGAPGSAGADGKNGTDGEDGRGVVTGPEPSGSPNCEGDGGVWVEVEGSGAKEFVCNGKDGSSASGTMTGDWSFTSKGPEGVLVSISFPQTLSAEPAQHYLASGEQTTECPGDYETPEALPGNLCVYEEGAIHSSKSSTGFESFTSDPLSGATWEMAVEAGEEGYSWGSWAVTPAATP